jgi:hypothetical protein
LDAIKLPKDDPVYQSMSALRYDLDVDGAMNYLYKVRPLYFASDDAINFMIKEGKLPAGSTPEKIRAIGGLQKEAMASIASPEKKVEEIDPVLQSAFQLVDSGAKDWSLYSADKKYALNKAGFKTEDQLNWLVGLNGDAGKYANMGLGSIMAKKVLLPMDAQVDFGGKMSLWLHDQLIDPKDEITKRYFDKYFDKTTGEPKESMLINEGQKVANRVKAMNERENLNQTEDSLLEYLIGNPDQVRLIISDPGNQARIAKQLADGHSSKTVSDMIRIYQQTIETEDNY